jgi:hypothetical protein
MNRGPREDEISLSIPDNAAGRKVGRTPVQFALGCPARRAYLLLVGADGRALALEQMAWDGVAWRLSLDLRPGSYRYRYYVVEGSRTADDVDGSDAWSTAQGRGTGGMDGVIEVPPQRPHPARCVRRQPGSPAHAPACGLTSLPEGFVTPRFWPG